MSIQVSISVTPPLLVSLSPELVPVLVQQAIAMPLSLEAIYSSKEELYSSIQV
jgi:hypothetical protein